MKKIISTITILAILMGMLSMTVFAENIEVADFPEGMRQFEMSEYEIYNNFANQSDEQLKKSGCSAEQIQQLKENSFESALLERASLPVEKLESMGYSSEEIALLKAYDGHKIVANDPLLVTIANCTGGCYAENMTTTTVDYTMNWTWDRMPLVLFDDYIAIAFQGYDSADREIRLKVLSNKLTVSYYTTEGSTYRGNREYSVTSASSSPENHRIENEGIKYTFLSGTNMGAYDVWAKRGRVDLSLSRYSASTAPINSVYLNYTYLHTTAEVLGGIAIDIEGNGSMAFSPAWAVDRVVYIQTNAYVDGRFETYSIGREKK